MALQVNFFGIVFLRTCFKVPTATSLPGEATPSHIMMPPLNCSRFWNTSQIAARKLRVDFPFYALNELYAHRKLTLYAISSVKHAIRRKSLHHFLGYLGHLSRLDNHF